MRDIRSDLKERLSAIDERMSELVREYNRDKENLDRAYAEQEKFLEQERTAAAAMLAVEQKRYGEDPPNNAGSVTSNVQLSDFLINQIKARPGIPKEELRKLAEENGYFAEGEAGGRSIHTTLMNLVRAKRITAVGDNHYRMPSPDELTASQTILGQAFS